MDVDITYRESSTLYRLLTEDTQDMVLVTDREGVIRHSSIPCGAVDAPFPAQILGRPIEELVDSAYAAGIRGEHDATIAGRASGKGLEFSAPSASGEQRWFELRMRALADEQGQIYGTIGIVRDIEDRRKLQDQLFQAAMTDPLTGLTNRRAFISMLHYLVERNIGGCLAIFNIDYFRAINMQHGLACGDETLVAFSNLLRSLMRSEDIVSRIGGESLGILLPQTQPEAALAICRRVNAHLAGVTLSLRDKPVSFTASAGVARIGGSVDGTLSRAELALFLAKAKGRNRVELEERPRTPWAKPCAYGIASDRHELPAADRHRELASRRA